MNMQNRKTKPTWMSPPDSVNKDNGEYKVRGPWEKRGDEELAEFERNLMASSNYEYHSMFETPELSEAKKKQIEDYKMNPPFNCGYNVVEEDKKTAKKLQPGKNPITRSPWTYGTLPADPPAFKIHERPPTALWSVPPEANKANNTIESSGDPILDSLRQQLKNHGASGIAGLARKFKIMDDDGSGTLNLIEFTKGMKECEVIDLSNKAISHLFRYFDRDDSGIITYDEFLVGIRGVMNKRRRNLVRMAFKIMDKDGSGQLDMADLKGVYDARGHPDVVQGRKTEEEILQGFIESFQVGKNKDAIVTLDEFESYYSNISASIDSDDYFELMIRNAWHISGGEGAYENTTNRRVLVTRTDGTQGVVEIKNDIGIRANDKEAMVNRLKEQGVAVGTINTNGAGGMNNQYEAKDFYKTRINQPQSEEPPLEDFTNVPKGNSRGNYYPPGRGGVAPVSTVVQRPASSNTHNSNNVVRAAPAPQRLSTFTNAPQQQQQQQPPQVQPARQSGNNNNLAPDVVKPVKLSDMMATMNLNETNKGPIKPVRLSDMLAQTENINIPNAANAATVNSNNYNSTVGGRRPSSSNYRR